MAINCFAIGGDPNIVRMAAKLGKFPTRCFPCLNCGRFPDQSRHHRKEKRKPQSVPKENRRPAFVAEVADKLSGSPVYRASRRSIRHRPGNDAASKATPLWRWYPTHFLFGEPRPRRTFQEAVFWPGSKRLSPRNRPAASAKFHARSSEQQPRDRNGPDSELGPGRPTK